MAPTPEAPRKLVSLRRLAILLCGLFTIVGTFLGVGGCMVMSMPGTSYQGPLAELTEDETRIAAGLQAHVTALAATIGPRSFKQAPQLAAAADWIEQQFGSLGLSPHREPYQATYHGNLMDTCNVVAESAGASQPADILIVGAHYDTVYITPGANDNASGIAVMLEIARLIGNSPHNRTVRFVAFSTEEPPWFKSDEMGSWVHAHGCQQRGEQIAGMISLETMGCYLQTPGTQKYPNKLLGNFYPDTGDYIAFVGNLSSGDLVRRAIGSFRSHTQFPSQGIAAPDSLPGVDFSDHWSFWQHSYPAIMLTDTAMLRYAHYHLPTDTADRLDYPRLARVTAGLARVVADLLK
ncbi:MAG: M28 family peptidase [Planctomycetota bacterium]